MTPAGSAPGPRPSAQAAAREQPLLRPLPGRGLRRRAPRCRAASTPRPGSVCASPTTRSRPTTPGAGSRSARRRPPSGSVDAGDGRRHPHPVAAQGHRGPGAGPLPGGPGPQTRRAGRGDRAGRRPRCGAFTAGHQRFWDAARRQLGDGPGTRALVGVLLLHRTMPADSGARRDGRRADDRAASTPTSSRSKPAAHARPPSPRPPVPLPATAAPGPPRIDRPAPTLAGYDDLLTGAAA